MFVKTLDLIAISDAELLKQSLQSIRVMWQPISSALHDLGQEEYDQLLNGITKFIGHHSKYKLTDSEVHTNFMTVHAHAFICCYIFVCRIVQL